MSSIFNFLVFFSFPFDPLDRFRSTLNQLSGLIFHSISEDFFLCVGVFFEGDGDFITFFSLVFRNFSTFFIFDFFQFKRVLTCFISD